MSITLSNLVTRIGDQGAYQNTDSLGTKTQQPIALINQYQMTYGATQNDATDTTIVPTKYYQNQHTITIASSVYTLDLTQLVDVFGNVLNFSKIYRIIVHNNDVVGGSGLIIKPGVSNGFTGPWNGSSSGQNDIPAGGDFVQSNPYVGWTVNGGVKNLTFQNDAASPSGNASFNLHLIGG